MSPPPPRASGPQKEGTSPAAEGKSAPAPLLPDDKSPVSCPQVVVDLPPGKPQAGASAASPSLQRYLDNPSSHEMRALRFATSSSLSTGTSTAPESPGPPLTPGNGPIVPGRDAGSQYIEAPASTSRPTPVGFIEPDPSISLSPSPPACPSPERDTEAQPELLGLASTKGKSAGSGRRGRVHRAMRQRTRNGWHKKDKNR